MIKAMLIENGDNGYTANLTEVDESQLPDGNVTVDIEWSTLNYKDALALTGKGRVVRRFPMVPGIDFAGRVHESGDSRYRPGDQVVMTGWGMGETRWGGYAQRGRVEGDMLVKLPEKMSLRGSMALGTAGLTAMLCVLALERQGVKPADGPVLVTGATGGVGSVAVKLLAGRGFEVIASTGKASERDYLLALGASDIIDRSELSAPGKPLAAERWAGAVDTAGGNTLANVCAATRYLGTVAACGLAEDMGFPATVAPFILRGVTLVGIDSVMCPKPLRQQAWDRLSEELPERFYADVSRQIALEDVCDAAEDLIAGKVRGRIVVSL
ncbi:MDR family oxidoreductase [Hoeflea olei]|uniref:Alcohol dehydrogenase n=1 Tax=Hoeflea olei TaxID=1480615 RepID=A0A1C1YR12_9HYPH|nr:MDR family oxidoreductase [Hoeflea olei]OCW55949.1 alcohol dehydrogenase [Hoeflea olei]